MVQVKVGNNMKRNTVVVDENTTLRQVLEQQEINYSTGVTTLDGAPLRPGDMDKTFAQFGIVEKCSLINCVKADNAAR
jgi:sulfur carrier protein ThiS